MEKKEAKNGKKSGKHGEAFAPLVEGKKSFVTRVSELECKGTDLDEMKKILTREYGDKWSPSTLAISRRNVHMIMGILESQGRLKK